MEQQAEAWQRPAGWYDVGGGWSAYWDGRTWTGDRMPTAQRWPGPQPPPAGQPKGGGVPRLWGTPWFVWLGLAVIVLIFGFPLIAALVEGFWIGLYGE